VQFASRLKDTYAAASYFSVRMLQMLSNKNITAILTPLALVLAASCSAHLLANTLEIPALANAVVQDGIPNNTFAGVLASELNTSGRGSIWLSLLQFDLSGLGPVQVKEPLKNYLTRRGGVEFAKKMLIYYV
jgi:hypothetical protein